MGIDQIISILLVSASLLQQGMYDAMPDKNMDGNLFLINRQHAVSRYYTPTVRKVAARGMSQSMRDNAATALEEMFSAAKSEGITLSVTSGYRSYSKQSTIYNRKVSKTGSTEKADELVARPGTSEHQLGLAMDISGKNSSSLSEAFGKTKEGIWLKDNCYRFGFIIRYPKGSEEITGYSYEPWHVRYVGKELAKKIYEADVPYETFMSGYKLEIYDYLIHQDSEK